jgi:hypothetical protein
VVLFRRVARARALVLSITRMTMMMRTKMMEKILIATFSSLKPSLLRRTQLR